MYSPESIGKALKSVNFLTGNRILINIFHYNGIYNSKSHNRV